MMHTFRLLDMAAEIAEGILLVRRPNRRNCWRSVVESDYDELLTEAEARLGRIAERRFAGVRCRRSRTPRS
ncbi:MAG: hypothetical protein U0176_14375 [Bacteroidia bacterium]